MLQTYANVIDGSVAPVAGAETNYNSGSDPWDVGSGLEELNGTHDMMGNVWEWMESPYGTVYDDTANRSIRGGFFNTSSGTLSASNRYGLNPSNEGFYIGFRVASIPEPCTLAMLAIGGVTAVRRIRAKD